MATMSFTRVRRRAEEKEYLDSYFRIELGFTVVFFFEVDGVWEEVGKGGSEGCGRGCRGGLGTGGERGV